MAQFLVVIGATLFFSLGTLHGLLTLRDLSTPEAGWLQFEVFSSSPVVQALTLVVAASYFVLSVRFWFWGPALGSGTALLCFLVSAFLCRVGAAA